MTSEPSSAVSDTKEVLEGVRLCLSQRMALDLEEIQPQTRIIDDLGSDSLDLLDLLFTLEKRFSIKLRDSQLDRLLRAETGTGQQHLSVTEVAQLCEWLPALRSAPDPATISPAALFSYVTVESLAILVESKLKGTLPA